MKERPLVFIGDSFATGATLRRGEVAYPNLVGQRVGVPVVVVAGGGTGFLNPGPKKFHLHTRGTHHDRIKRLPRSEHELLIQVSINDRMFEPSQLERAIDKYLDHLDIPPLAMFGPIFGSPATWSDRIPMIADIHESVCSRRAIPYVDGRPWFSNAEERGLTGPDRAHPSAEGHRVIADRVTELLCAL